MPSKRIEDKDTAETEAEVNPESTTPVKVPTAEVKTEPSPKICPYMSQVGPAVHGYSLDATFIAATCIGPRCAIYAKCQG